MASMVREAIDERFGTDLKPYLSFFEETGSSKNQSGGKETEHA